jgi:hypothetical protein
MSYLYGDSTPSKLEINYIDFLRDAVEFCVQLMLADQRIGHGKAQTRALELATASEFERLQKLGGIVSKAFEGASLGAADSATARCAAAILRSASDLVRQEAVLMRGTLDDEINKRDAQAGQERDGMAKALEALLVKHLLPGAAMEVHVAITGGTRYAGRARMKTGFGLDAVLDLDVPAGHLFERVVRVDRLMERLDVMAPEVGGWLHKEVKKRPQHLEKHHILEFSSGAAGAALKLRVGPDGTGAGFDVKFAPEEPHVLLARAEQPEGGGEPAFEEVDADDAKKLLALHAKLAAATADLTAHRRRLVDARLEGEPVRTHAKPTMLAERLINAMAPVVQEISARSQSPGELVLRRMIGGDRREEIFLSKADLKVKLEPLVEGNRALFEPLWASATPAPSRPVVVSDMPTPVAVPAHGQAMRYRPSTPPIGSPSLSSSIVAAAASTSAAASAAAAVRPAGDSSAAGDALRRTLIGTTVEAAVQSATDSVAAKAAFGAPAASSSAGPLSSDTEPTKVMPAQPAKSLDSAPTKVMAADLPKVEHPKAEHPKAEHPKTDTPAPVRETAPRIEIVRGGDASSRTGPPKTEVAGTIDSKVAKN